MTSRSGDVAALVAAIEPFDETERVHRADALAWLDRTPDIYRRVRPATPPRHLVSYAFLTDPREFSGGRWWTRPQLGSADPALFDPEMGRFLAKLRSRPRA